MPGTMQLRELSPTPRYSSTNDNIPKKMMMMICYKIPNIYLSIYTTVKYDFYFIPCFSLINSVFLYLLFFKQS